MSDPKQPGGQDRPPPPAGLVSSPRAYFGRASRAANPALRDTIADSAPPSESRPQRGGRVYRAGDPALRLFAGLALPCPLTTPLTGAIATLSGMRDGEHEKLFIDLGTSLVRATLRRDEKAGELSLILSRSQSADIYRSLLASIRYVNDAPTPTGGVRGIVLQIVDAAGRIQEVEAAEFGVGEAPPERAGPPAIDRRVTLGDAVTFNRDGDFTLFFWPSRAQTGGGRGPHGAVGLGAAARTGGSFFSGGGREYRVFAAPPARAVSPPRLAAAGPRAANDSAPAFAAARPARAAAWAPAPKSPPGSERARVLRLEDVFGSDVQDAIPRRHVEERVAAGE